MGPSPPRPPPSVPRLFASADDWFFQASDRDNQLLTQALTLELSSCSRDPASSSVLPSASAPAPAPAPAPCSSSSLYETFRRCLEGGSVPSQRYAALRALQQQQQQRLRQQQQQQHQQPQNCHHQQQQEVMAVSSTHLRGDGFLYADQNSLQKGSFLSKSASPPLSASPETPASPFSTSTVSTNSAMSTKAASDRLLTHSKQNNPHHHDSQDGHFVRTMAPSSKALVVAPVSCDSSLSSRTASTALSSQESVGASGNKVNKRRSRGSSKAPIAVLSADTSNFRAMVQQLTGIPSSNSSMHSYQSGIPLLKPQPIRQAFPSTLDLPTLDTSACFLGPRNMKEGFSFAQGPHQLSSGLAANSRPFSGVDPSHGPGHNVENNMHRRHVPHFNDQANVINQSLPSSLPGLPRLQDSLDSLKPSANFASLHDKGEQISVTHNAMLTPATFESLLMEEHLVPRSPFNSVDSWLCFDAASANHASNMEVARMA